MSKILIYGAPGAGKTTASNLLHERSGIELYEGDYLREVALPKETTEADNPFIFVGTKQAWRHFGELNRENVIKGLLAVRSSMRPYVDRELAKYANVIFEAAFLDPAGYSSNDLFLVVTADKSKHRSQFFDQRQEMAETLEEFTAARMIQDYLLDEAKRLDIKVIENAGDLDGLIRQFN